MDLTTAKKGNAKAKMDARAPGRVEVVGITDGVAWLDTGAKRALMDAAIRETLDAAEVIGWDSGSSIFARVLVQQTLGELFRHEYPEMKWLEGGLISIDESLHPGTPEFGYDEIALVGEAKIINPDADDVPNAEIVGERTVHKVVHPAVGFQWSRQELRTAQLQGTFGLVQEKARSAREAWSRLINRLIPFGNATLVGLLRGPGIMVRVAANGPWTAASDPLDVIADFSAAVTDQMTTTDGVETPDTVVMPLNTMRILETLPFSTLDGTPVMDVIQRMHPFIRRWDWAVEMDTASFAGGPAIAIYRNDPMRVRAVMPMRMTPVPEQEVGLRIKVGIESRYGGVIHPRPRSVLLLQGV